MTPEAVLNYLRQRPFVPFRVHLSDGTQYEVRHPESVIVSRREMTVGVRGTSSGAGPYDRLDLVSLLHVTRLEPLNAEVT